MELSDVGNLSRTILRHAITGVPRVEFMRQISQRLLDFIGCELLGIRVWGDIGYSWSVSRSGLEMYRLRLPVAEISDPLERAIERLSEETLHGTLDSLTERGSFYASDLSTARLPEWAEALRNQKQFKAMMLVPFVIDTANKGVLCLMSELSTLLDASQHREYGELAQIIGLAIANRRAQAALAERVKELTCLYGIARIVEKPGLTLDERLEQIVLLLPPAWQYPDVASARIVFDGRSYQTHQYCDTRHRQKARIVIRDAVRGEVELAYLAEKPDFVEGAFLAEEESLIATVAREVSLIVEREEAEAERTRLREQIRHADRLATIGKLSAGVAHELNEPLGNILGFAQLIADQVGLPEQVVADTRKIVNASLHAREIVRKLLIFARQMPIRKAAVALNEVIDDSLYFLEARCAKKDIRVQRQLCETLPPVQADAGQLQQVLVNLVVNAIDAMGQGGVLTIRTAVDEKDVVLVVSDTGSGIDPQSLEKIFLPFYTTKDVGRGTGLGLAVVHGIVSAHNGTIEPTSEMGRGSRFVVRLPAVNPVAVAEGSR